MRISLCAVLVVFVAACAPARPVRKTQAPVLLPAAVSVATAPGMAPPVSAPPLSISPAPLISARMTSIDVAGVTLEGIAFDSRTHRLVVVDQPGGPGSRFADSASAGRSMGGIAAVNAGFFTPEGAPLGLVMASGKKSGTWNSASSLGNSVWYGNGSSMGISRRDNLGRTAAGGMNQLIQAGPLLVENGKAVGGLESVKNSARIAVLWDGGTRWWIGRGSPCTLAEFANALSSFQPSGWKVKQALNLDGGRSADLWISAAVSGGPVVRRSPFNRPVRNFLVVVGN